MIRKFSNKFQQNTHNPGFFGILKHKMAIFLNQKAHRSGNVLGSIRNAGAKLVVLLHLIRDFGQFWHDFAYVAVIPA
jgi:hypothetical protein